MFVCVNEIEIRIIIQIQSIRTLYQLINIPIAMNYGPRESTSTRVLAARQRIVALAFPVFLCLLN